MLRLFSPAPPSDGRLEIGGDEFRHFHTWRLGVGDRLIVFDASGGEHAAIVTAVLSRSATLRIESTRQVDRESLLEVTLAAALLKGRKLDLVIEKATELGVSRVVPFMSAHTVGERDHRERWERIALAAAKQSGRTRVPAVDAAVSFPELLTTPSAGLKLLAWEDEAAQRLRDLPVAATSTLIVVGPEGGFAPHEVAAAHARDFATITLGPRVLRAETAAIVAVALLQQRWGDG